MQFEIIDSEHDDMTHGSRPNLKPAGPKAIVPASASNRAGTAVLVPCYDSGSVHWRWLALVYWWLRKSKYSGRSEKVNGS